MFLIKLLNKLFEFCLYLGFFAAIVILLSTIADIVTVKGGVLLSVWALVISTFSYVGIYLVTKINKDIEKDKET